MNELSPVPMTNGKGAAAIMAVAVGSLALGVFTLTGDAVPAAAGFFTIWNPTGPLSGVTDATILVWLVTWFVLSKKWAAKDIKLKRVNAAAVVLIVAGLLLTFPPFMDLLQGK